MSNTEKRDIYTLCLSLASVIKNNQLTVTIWNVHWQKIKPVGWFASVKTQAEIHMIYLFVFAPYFDFSLSLATPGLRSEKVNANLESFSFDEPRKTH